MKPFYNKALIYALGGVLFGLSFVIFVAFIQQKSLLFWIVCIIPLIFGFLAFTIGQQSNRLKEKGQHLQKMKSQLILQERMASIGMMTAGIAHEIKNPLNFVYNFAEGSTEIVQDLEEEIKVIRSSIDQDRLSTLLGLIEDLKHNSEDIKTNCDRVNEIVFTLMDHTRGSKGAAQSTNINSLLDKNINLAYHSYRANYASFNMDIKKSYDPSLPEVMMNSHSLGRVLINILNNACYALNQKQEQLGKSFEPLIKLATHKVDDWLKIIIEDNGNGIPEPIRQKIFDPFFTTKPTGSGNSGLGLSISKEIIEGEYRGRIEVESQKGHFTKFVISIPIDIWASAALPLVHSSREAI